MRIELQERHKDGRLLRDVLKGSQLSAVPDVHVPRLPVLCLVAATAPLSSTAVGLAVTTPSTAITLPSTAPAAPSASATFSTCAAAKESTAGQLRRGKRGVSRLRRVRRLLQTIPVSARLVHGLRQFRVCLAGRQATYESLCKEIKM